MNKKTKIICISLAALIVLGAGAATAYTAYTIACVDPEAQILRDLKAQQGENGPSREKIKGLPILEKLEKEMCARMNLSKKEHARIVEEKRKGHEEHLREVEEWKRQGLLEPKKLPPSDLGIKTLDPVLHWSVFRQTNVWQGYLDKNNPDSLIIVAAGGSYPDPMQGMVVVLEKSFGGSSKTYPTPTATGPVKIVSETNGVLTLESLAGEFEVYHEDTDTREKIKTPGGKAYYFNVRTKTFQQN